MKKISYSLWGKQDKYIVGAIENVKLAKQFFPGWDVVIYYDRTVPRDAVHTLDSMISDHKLLLMPADDIQIAKSMWRFLEGGNVSNSCVLFRDCDSRLSAREAQLVDVWARSGKPFNIILDHPGHANEVLAGTFGIRPAFMGKRFDTLLRSWPSKNAYGDDQKFLKNGLNALLTPVNTLVFEDLNPKQEFIGQVYNEKNQPVEWTPPHWE